MALPSMLEPQPEGRWAKYIKIGIGILLAALLLAGIYWGFFRFHSEDAIVNQFMNDVVAGNYQAAYKMWHPNSSYAFQDFLQDWSTTGYYGPIRSFRIAGTREPSDASGVIVIVEVSSFQPFPSQRDIERGRETKEVRLWVQFSDRTISYAPFTP